MCFDYRAQTSGLINNANMHVQEGRLRLNFDEGDAGIRTHNFLTQIFVRIFGSGIFMITNDEGETFYLNKKSLVTWINNAKELYKGRLTHDTAELTSPDLNRILCTAVHCALDFYKQGLELSSSDYEGFLTKYNG